MNRGMGPICSKKYYTLDYVPTNDEWMMARGMVAMGNMDTDFKEIFLNAPDPRTASNLLVKWASKHYDQRKVVMDCAEVVRALGFPVLAKKLEADRVTVTAYKDGAFYHIAIPYMSKCQTDLAYIDGAEEGDKDGRRYTWKVPTADKVHLMAILGYHFGGKLLYEAEDSDPGSARTIHVIPKAAFHQIQACRSGDTQGAGNCRMVPDGDWMSVFTDYDVNFVADIKGLPWKDRKWDRTVKCWRVKTKHKADVLRMIKAHYGVDLT